MYLSILYSYDYMFLEHSGNLRGWFNTQGSVTPCRWMKRGRPSSITNGYFNYIGVYAVPR